MWWSLRKGLQEITILVDEDWPIVPGQQQFKVPTSVLDVGMFSFVHMDMNVEKLLSKSEKWV
jgi:hypothetical protein